MKTIQIGGLLGINDAINQVFTDIWQALVGLLTAVINLVLNIGAVPISTTDSASPIAGLWPAMLTVGGSIAVILFFAQLAMAAFHPRRHLTHAVTGPVAYGVAIAVTVTVVAVTLSAADGLTTLVLQQAAHVDDVGGAVGKLGIANTTISGVKPVALALMGIVAVLPLSIGFAVEMLFRAMAILVLVGTIPLTAAGLTNSATRHWYWRAARWILAAIFIKPTLAITVAIGVLVVGNAHPPAGNAAQGLVTLLLGLGILFVSLFAPFALYRLFAFVEPGTMPHEAMRSAFNDARASFSQAAGAATNPLSNAPGLMSDAASRRWGGGNAADPASSSPATSPAWPTAGFSGASSGSSSSNGSGKAAALVGAAGAAAAVAATGGAAAPVLAAGSSATSGAAAGTGAAGGASAAGTGAGAAAVDGSAAASGASAAAGPQDALGAAGGGPPGGSRGGSSASGSSTGGSSIGGSSIGGSSIGGSSVGGSSMGAGWSGEPGAADDPLWSQPPNAGSSGGGGGGGGGRSGAGGGGRGHYGVGAISGGPSGLPGAVPHGGGGYDAPPPRPGRGDPGGVGAPRGPLPGRSPVPRHLDDLDPIPDPPEPPERDDNGPDPSDGADDGPGGWRRGEGRGLSGVL